MKIMLIDRYDYADGGAPHTAYRLQKDQSRNLRQTFLRDAQSLTASFAAALITIPGFEK